MCRRSRRVRIARSAEDAADDLHYRLEQAGCHLARRTGDLADHLDGAGPGEGVGRSACGMTGRVDAVIHDERIVEERVEENDVAGRIERAGAAPLHERVHFHLPDAGQLIVIEPYALAMRAVVEVHAGLLGDTHGPVARGAVELDLPAAGLTVGSTAREWRAAAVTAHGVHALTLHDLTPQGRRIDATQPLHFALLEPHTATARAVVERERRAGGIGERHLLHLEAETDGTGIAGLERGHSRSPLELDLSPRFCTSWKTYTTTPESVTSKSASPRTESASRD